MVKMPPAADSSPEYFYRGIFTQAADVNSGFGEKLWYADYTECSGTPEPARIQKYRNTEIKYPASPLWVLVPGLPWADNNDNT